MKKLPVPILCDDKDLIPVYASDSAAGADLKANLLQHITIQPGTTAVIPTGIRIALPHGYEAQIRPRSGLAAKNGITVLNTPGTIDADYRGEICVILINHSKEPFTVTPKMRIAQLIVAPVQQVEFLIEQSLTATLRGEGKFGHTGTH